MVFRAGLEITRQTAFGATRPRQLNHENLENYNATKSKAHYAQPTPPVRQKSSLTRETVRLAFFIHSLKDDAHTVPKPTPPDIIANVYFGMPRNAVMVEAHSS